MNSFLQPGQIVRNPAELSWGLGQIQSVVGNKITVNFEHVGKVVVNVALVQLEIAE